MSTKINQTNLSLLTSQSSSNVEQLYAKFENLKQRITNTDSKRSNKSVERKYAGEGKERDGKYRRIGIVQPMPVSVYLGMRNQSKLGKKEHVSGGSDGTGEGKVLMERVMTIISQTQQKYTDLLSQLARKLSFLQSKLQLAQGIIRQRRLQDNRKIKLNQYSQIENVNNTNDYYGLKNKNSVQESIRQLLGKNDVNNNNINNSINKDTLVTIQQLLLKKQSHISELQIQNRRLKRTLQQLNLTNQLHMKQNKQLKDENRVFYQKVEGFKRVLQTQKKTFDMQIQKYQRSANLKSLQIKQLKQDNQLLIMQLNNTCNISSNNIHNNTHNETKHSKDTGSSQTIELNLHLIGEEHQRNSSNNKDCNNNRIKNKLQKQANHKRYNQDIVKKQTQPQSYQLQTVLTDRSEIIDEINEQREKKQSQEIIQLQMLNVKELQQIKHSQSLVLLDRLSLTGGLNDTIISKKKQKYLLDEIHLLEQQNRLLKQKKDKFQAQIFKSQNDQDMMQQQLCRLNHQIRRLNSLWQVIDQCAVKLLKGQQLKQDKILCLEKQSKLREEYYKKRQTTKKRGFSLRR